MPVTIAKEHAEFIPEGWRRLPSFCISDNDSYAALCDHLRKGLGTDGNRRLGKKRARSDRFKHWNIPLPRNRYFLDSGRIDELHQILCGQSNGRWRTAVLFAKPGMGKTCVATEYAYRFFEKPYRAAFWVHGESEAAIAHSFVDIAQKLDLPESKGNDQRRAMAAARQWFENSRDWLLVFDNVKKPELAAESCPRSDQGHAIFTTRHPEFPRQEGAERLPLSSLNSDEAVEFLQKQRKRATRSDRELKAARELAVELGCLPLALEQAGAYMRKAGGSFSRYLKTFRERKLSS